VSSAKVADAPNQVIEEETMNRTNFTIAIGIIVTALISIGLAEDQDAERKALLKADNQNVSAEETREVHYDPRSGSQPTEFGFRLLDNDRGHTAPRVNDGMLSQGPTTKNGYQRWYSHKVPFDFANGGVAVEWVAKVKQSTIHSVPAEGKLWAGWGVQLLDGRRRAFDVYLAGDRVMLNRDNGNFPVAVHKFDTTDRFHHYRFVVDDAQGMLFIDHDPTPALVADVGGPDQRRWARENELGFGDCTTGASCEVQLRSLFYSNDPRAKTPPELATTTRDDVAPMHETAIR